MMGKPTTTLSKMSNTSAIVPWQSLAPTQIPKTISDPSVMVQDYAIALRQPDRQALQIAFSNHQYAMAAGHLWRRAMSKLRARLAKLGMRFLGEMLNRDDIDEDSSPESVLSDADAISLAESLGYVDGTGAHRLRTGFETLSHFDQEDTSEEMSVSEAAIIVRACVQYVVGSQDNDVALDFSKFRTRLTSESLRADDGAVQNLTASPPFFLRTALRVLIASVKTEKGAKLEYALANLIMILPLIWPEISDEDRWSIGKAFLEVTGAGNNPGAVAGIKKALLRVRGFDYVPENLRSNSFRQAAAAVMQAHNSYGNYEAEVQPTRVLASMGNIPLPALTECIRAFICVYIGNKWGNSWSAETSAFDELKKLSQDRWMYFLSKSMPTEQDILYKLLDEKPVERWISLCQALKFDSTHIENKLIRGLIDASLEGKRLIVARFASRLLSEFKGYTIE